MAKRFLGILGIFIIGIAFGIIISKFSPLGDGAASSEQVSMKVKNLYEIINPGVRMEVVKIDDVSGMYKGLFKATDASGTVTYRETYFSKDGKFLTENIILVDQSISQLTKIHNFVDCLQNSSVRIAGISNNTATLLQFNALGGSYATKLYLSCDGDLAQQCVNVGITQVPAIIYQNKGYPGPQPIPFFENLTACKF